MSDRRCGPVPAFSTAHEDLPDESERICDSAARFGLTLMPWQRDALAVATQHDGGAYRWPVVVVSVPRQSGKSVALKALVLDRLINGGLHGPWEGALIAQTRQDAARFLIDWSEHRDLGMKVYRGLGNEQLHLGANQVRPYAPMPSAMHGRSLNAVLWDEAWSVDAERGREIMQAATPAMITKRDRQTWFVSTAGTPESVFLRSWVEKGRAGEVCLIEYAAPGGADVDDLAGWARWHPAFGFTQDADGIRQARAMFEGDDAGFRRAYCNQWPEAHASRGAIDPEAWSALADEAPPVPERGSAVLAIDVDMHALSASIVAAWRDVRDGLTPGPAMRIELVDHRPGVSWLLPRLRGLMDTHGVRTVWAQDYGPVVATTDALERERVSVERVGSKQASAAVQAFLTAVAEGTVRHNGQDELTRAALSVGLRSYGDGVQWQRKGGAATSPITAASWAVWAISRKKTRKPLRIVVSA
jgi:hypothetical protein